MQKPLVVTALTALIALSGCVSESTYLANERQVTQRNVDNTEAAKTRISLGLNYLRRGDSTQALYNLDRARTMAPNLPEVYNALAFYYQTVGEHAQAENAYKQAIAKDSNNADAYNNYGAFLCQIGKYPEAERLLLSAISKPGYIRVAESYENLALCQLEQDGFAQAKTYFGSSITHNSTRISALINSASLNYAMGNLADAKTDLQRIQRLGRVSARSTLLNYLVSEKQGDVTTMRHAEQLLLTLYIDSNEARQLLQQRLQESEFEKLRERYKQYLLASLQQNGAAPTAVSASQTVASPVANPQLRIRRKVAAEATTQPAEQTDSSSSVATEQATRSFAPPPEAQSTLRPIHQVTEIAASLQTTSAARVPDALPQEQVLTYATQAPDADTVTGEYVPQVPVHIVREGESLHSISVSYNILLTALQEWNKLRPDSRLRIGQRIWLGPNDAPPEPTAPPVRLASAQPVDEYYHLVADGDTMFAISYRYNIRLDRFMAWNQLTEQSRLTIGQKLYIVDPASINHD